MPQCNVNVMKTNKICHNQNILRYGAGAYPKFQPCNMVYDTRHPGNTKENH